MVGEATPSAKRAMDKAGAHPVTEIESAVKDAKNLAPVSPIVVRAAYATLGGTATPVYGRTPPRERLYDDSRKNDHRFASDPFGSEPPNYRH